MRWTGMRITRAPLPTNRRDALDRGNWNHVPVGTKTWETRRPNTTVDETASEGTTMAIRYELELKPQRGRLARSVFAALLLVLPLAVSTCFARPAPQAPRP